MRKVLRHKWAIALGALLLALAIGTGAWAATSAASSLPTLGCAGGRGDLFEWSAEEGNRFGPGQWCPPMREHRERQDKCHGAVLQLVRDKMTPEDQAALDTLIRQAESQREELKNAASALGDTMKQIKDLVDKYLPAEGDTSGPPAGSSS